MLYRLWKVLKEAMGVMGKPTSVGDLGPFADLPLGSELVEADLGT